MYDLKDIAAKDFTLLSEFDIVKLEGVKGISVEKIEGEPKTVTIQLSIYDYLFSGYLKQSVKTKIVNDLGIELKIKFGI